MKLHYQCEKCRYIYPRRWQATYCEKMTIPVSKYKVGDRITIKLRYGGPAKDVVKRVRLAPNYLNDPMSAWESEAGFLERMETMSCIENGFHHWVYEVSNYYELGKEWYTSQIPEDSIKDATENRTQSSKGKTSTGN